MKHVSGVTGAAPLLHDVVEHLHEQYGTTWYPVPANVVECWIHPVTGKRLDPTATRRIPDAVREKFLASNLPPLESPADYDTTGSHRQLVVRLGNEYREWLASSDNWLGDRAVLAPTQSALRILFPPPGTILYLDPDLPQQGRRVSLQRRRARQPPMAERLAASHPRRQPPGRPAHGRPTPPDSS